MRVLVLAGVAFVGSPLLGFLLMFNGMWAAYYVAIIAIISLGFAGEDLKVRRSTEWNRSQSKGGTFTESSRARAIYDLLLQIHGVWKLTTLLFLLGGIIGFVAHALLR